MPGNWLRVPHFQQEFEYSCVAACVRMVLAHHGDLRNEAELRALFDTQPTGTRAGNIMRLSGSAYEVNLRSSNLVELQKSLADNVPLIIFLKTGPLEYWNMDIFHVAVPIGLDSVTVALNDPYFANAPQATSMQSFEKAWAETSCSRHSFGRDRSREAFGRARKGRAEKRAPSWHSAIFRNSCVPTASPFFPGI
jgi:ABC-type bacteriocin/lantibiotic exporter with double-glycine peptidase domain